MTHAGHEAGTHQEKESGMTATQDKTPDLQPIIGESTDLKIDGMSARVGRLRAREVIRLVGIITRGLGDNIRYLRFDTENVQATLTAAFVMAVPNALDETLAFVASIVHPVVPDDAARLRAALENPDLETVLDILGVVALQESDEMKALVGKARALLVQIQKAYQPQN